MAKTEALEELMILAKRRATKRGITEAAAFAQVLSERPDLYQAYLDERSAAGAPGSGRAERYAQQVDELLNAR